MVSALVLISTGFRTCSAAALCNSLQSRTCGMDFDDINNIVERGFQGLRYWLKKDFNLIKDKYWRGAHAHML